HWCHMCLRTVDPIREIDTMKCPICEGGFIEETATAMPPGNDVTLDLHLGGSDSDRALSLWAPILLGMVGNPRSRNRIRRSDLSENESDTQQQQQQQQQDNASDSELDRELELILLRRRSSAAILQLLRGIRAGIQSESGNSSGTPDSSDRETGTERERERVILINHLNETIIVQGSSNRRTNEPRVRASGGRLGDYFIGPGLDSLLQQLLENDPNRYGTPPARKEAVDDLPVVKTEEKMQCSVCLEECEIGSEVREMPCKHRFHGSCILPWLQLHSSCPVCRFQIPCDESKL
ncbi:hypothetical protein M569_01875, partial [Genlisea aurea]